MDAVQSIEIQEFLDASGRSPFARWFEGLNSMAAARVTVVLARLSLGNFSKVEGAGGGFFGLGGSARAHQSQPRTRHGLTTSVARE